ncbi:MAG: ferrous iron transport protein [Flavisolibacter sp.]|jgi:ferrous iron transport protein A|nr:ferrous iron transport protein [Flavisolibacter sp.]
MIELALKAIMTLSQLKAGQQGFIKGFESSDLELKLMEMGCIPGELVTVEQIAPLGDPISIRVSGYSLSLRKNEANQIILED